MNLSLETVLLIGTILLVIDLIVVVELFSNRLKGLVRIDRENRINEIFTSAFTGEEKKLNAKKYLGEMIHLKESLVSSNITQGDHKLSREYKRLERRYTRRLKSIYWLTRAQAAVKLGIHGSEKSRLALEKAILKERNFPCKLYMANALGDIKDPRSIPILVSSLLNSHRWYRRKVNMIIASFSEDFNDYIDSISQRTETEIKELIIDFAKEYPSTKTKAYLLKYLDEKEYNNMKHQYALMNKADKCCGNCIRGRKSDPSGKRLCKIKGPKDPLDKCRRFKRLPVSIEGRKYNQKLREKAAFIVSEYYPEIMLTGEYDANPNPNIRNSVINALSKYKDVDSFERMMCFIGDKETQEFFTRTLVAFLGSNPEYLQVIIDKYEKVENESDKKILIGILAEKAEYLLIRLKTYNNPINKKIIEDIVYEGRNTRIIDFLNNNSLIGLENEILEIIKGSIMKNEAVKKEYGMYLDERILKKLNLEKIEDTAKRISFEAELEKQRNLVAILIVIILLVPIVYIIRYWDVLTITSLPRQLRTYITDFNYYLVYYSLLINFVYIILLFLSNINVKKQTRLWNMKSMSLMFKKNMLPSISVIAPAYNEEKTIIESITSLLNLKYPDYELIVVNDGSKDRTLDTMIDYFNLTRVEKLVDIRISTKAIRGIYRNESIPNLLVVDKYNGGKADSLNAGINISEKEYFCGIDADSILEDDALLKLASIELDMGVETPAMGGNVFAANGCSIDKGVITDVSIPRNRIARLQLIEYIRAFMSGRLGWTQINGLLIISGAFGLFRKERVLQTGGYLTKSGKYEKDTVGEDMEIVVRIRRQMEEAGQRFRIGYAYNANCWTEVPEKYSALKKQRLRWHNGLIDVLFFHRKMLFNPKHRTSGLLSMPYFLIFETIGPIFEVQGYLMMLISYLLGFLNLQVFLMLFIASIMMGVLISLTSVLIAENESRYFKIKDIFALILYAVLENFGPRQMISLWRALAYVRLLVKEEGWEKLERKGFSQEKKVA